jgi:hypothetical protein
MHLAYTPKLKTQTQAEKVFNYRNTRTMEQKKRQTQNSSDGVLVHLLDPHWNNKKKQKTSGSNSDSSETTEPKSRVLTDIENVATYVGENVQQPEDVGFSSNSKMSTLNISKTTASSKSSTSSSSNTDISNQVDLNVREDMIATIGGGTNSPFYPNNLFVNASKPTDRSNTDESRFIESQKNASTMKVNTTILGPGHLSILHAFTRDFLFKNIKILSPNHLETNGDIMKQVCKKIDFAKNHKINQQAFINACRTEIRKTICSRRGYVKRKIGFLLTGKLL